MQPLARMLLGDRLLTAVPLVVAGDLIAVIANGSAAATTPITAS
jgi:hypothetical protein